MSSPEAQILNTPSRKCPGYLHKYIKNLTFPYRFEVDRFISLGYLEWSAVDPGFVQKLRVQPNIQAVQQQLREFAFKRNPSLEINLKYGGVFDDGDAGNALTFPITLTYRFSDDKAYFSRKAKNQAMVIRAEVGIDKIQFFLIPHNPNKLILKFGEDRIMRVKFKKISHQYLKSRAMRQAHLIFQHGIELAGRRYKYSPFLVSLKSFTLK